MEGNSSQRNTPVENNSICCKNIAPKPATRFQCDFCDSIFSSKNKLTVHKRNAHTDVSSKALRIPIIDDLSLMDLTDDEKEQHSSVAIGLKEASSISTVQANLVVPEDVVISLLSCEQCDFTCETLNELNDHIATNIHDIIDEVHEF